MKRIVLPLLLATALPAADSRIMPAMNAFTTASYKQLARDADSGDVNGPFRRDVNKSERSDAGICNHA